MIKIKFSSAIDLISAYIICLGVIALGLLLSGVWKNIYLIIINIAFIIACFIFGACIRKLYNWARTGTIIILLFLIAISLLVISFNSLFYFFSSLGGVIIFSIIPIIIIKYLLNYNKMEWDTERNKKLVISEEEKKWVRVFVVVIVVLLINTVIMVISAMNSEKYNPKTLSIDLNTRTVSITSRIEEPRSFEECISTKQGIIVQGYPEHCKFFNLTFVNPDQVNVPTSEPPHS